MTYTKHKFIKSLFVTVVVSICFIFSRNIANAYSQSYPLSITKLSLSSPVKEGGTFSLSFKLNNPTPPGYLDQKITYCHIYTNIVDPVNKSLLSNMKASSQGINANSFYNSGGNINFFFPANQYPTIPSGGSANFTFSATLNAGTKTVTNGTINVKSIACGSKDFDGFGSPSPFGTATITGVSTTPTSIPTTKPTITPTNIRVTSTPTPTPTSAPILSITPEPEPTQSSTKDEIDIDKPSGSEVLLENKNGCENFQSISFKSKLPIKGKIIINSIKKEDIDQSKFPSQDKNKSFGLCKIDIEGFSINDLENIKLQSRYKIQWAKDNQIDENKLKVIFTNDINQNIDQVYDVRQLDNIKIGEDDYSVLESNLTQIPINYTIGIPEEKIQQAQQSVNNSPIILLIMLLIIIIGGAIGGVVYYKREMINKKNSAETESV